MIKEKTYSTSKTPTGAIHERPYRGHATIQHCSTCTCAMHPPINPVFSDSRTSVFATEPSPYGGRQPTGAQEHRQPASGTSPTYAVVVIAYHTSDQQPITSSLLEHIVSALEQLNESRADMPHTTRPYDRNREQGTPHQRYSSPPTKPTFEHPVGNTYSLN